MHSDQSHPPEQPHSLAPGEGDGYALQSQPPESHPPECLQNCEIVYTF